MDRYLNEQLSRLQTDHIDFYFIHGLVRPFWEKLYPLRVTEFLDDALADGRIKYAGFSFHDDIGLFREFVHAYDWTFCQIQYNFMDERYQAGTEGLEYAAENGLGIVVMEPLRGGMLTKEIPAISDRWKRDPVKRSLLNGLCDGFGAIPKSQLSFLACQNMSRSCRTLPMLIKDFQTRYLRRNLPLCGG